jgi:hypothetical protein
MAVRLQRRVLHACAVVYLREHSVRTTMIVIINIGNDTNLDAILASGSDDLPGIEL